MLTCQPLCQNVISFLTNKVLSEIFRCGNLYWHCYLCQVQFLLFAAMFSGPYVVEKKISETDYVMSREGSISENMQRQW